MSSRIQTTFSRLQAAGKRALIPYITAGDPNPGMTVGLMQALVKGGADIIELGVPFTDPSADGPVIQRATERALAHGVSLRSVIAMVAEFRKTDDQTPVVLMGYANPVEAMGYEAFAAAASEAGIDGLLTVDLPPDEAPARVAVLQRFGIDPIFLLAPTTPPQRAQTVGKLARGYVYYVSLKGVTGASHLNVGNVAEKLAELRQYIPLPIGVGFGIRDAASARAVSDCADAVVIGTRIVQEFEQGPDGLAERLIDFLSGVRAALDEPRT
ncbi:tryptophan synthase subunit alpha [Viridibacterium curvum]|uniref:Tryptophan synthase alpha chain n=1 Tax=Viridibacterium curvum TaxID=1101404 RepID=A0ABP9QG75_9RHOO